MMDNSNDRLRVDVDELSERVDRIENANKPKDAPEPATSATPGRTDGN
jgi:hypothetical protein